MAERFTHESAPARVLFGAGRAADTPEEAARLGSRPLLIVDPVAASIAGRLVATLDAAAVAVIDEVRQHVPVADADAARSTARKAGADVVISFGGGSTIGLAKAVALTEHLPIVAVPTTYSGSEMTPVWGLTTDGTKTTGIDPVVAPRTVVYDPELTLSMPASTTAASGLNAMAHCIDALWARGRTPLTDTMAERGIASLAQSLPATVRDGQDLEAREQMLVGAWVAGTAFAVAGSSLHHKLCHVLGGRFDLPHAETHAAMLPWTSACALRRHPRAAAAIVRALGAGDPTRNLLELVAEAGAPTSLAELGLREKQTRALADSLDIDAMHLTFTLPRDELRQLLLEAYGLRSN
ncbi:MAG TPA: maleylacetate reductase [Baekduia sp.]|nr:maleylacetate reductase [Baekduia sp.]